MCDVRCWREVFIRGGMTLTISIIAFFTLGTGPWIFVLPAGVTALVLLKWATRPLDGESESAEHGGNPLITAGCGTVRALGG